MRAPLSWLKEFVEIPESISAEEIAQGLIRVGFEVEEIIEEGADTSGPLIVGKVIDIEEITEFKKAIRYVGLDCGEKQIRHVICGATNFSVGDLVVVAMPGAVLPGNFQISARETYGKTSNGMICSARELGISEEHSGIIVLNPDEVSIGEDAISKLQLNDVIFDISVNPDRGYALSIRGVAREIAGAFGFKFTDPVDRLRNLSWKDSGKGVSAKIDGSDLASVFYLRTVSGFNSATSVPLWMSRRIEKIGMRSISLAVDITNYVMFELGQPLHAFDANKIEGGLVLKKAGSTKDFTTLDGQERKLDPEDLMVWDSLRPRALAGVMGGQDSEISATSTEIAIEAIRFNPKYIAQSSRRHKISSEASKRFERGVDPSLAEFSSARAVELFIELGGAKHVSTVKDGQPRFNPIIKLNPVYVNQTLGLDLSPSDIASTLRIIGCDVDEKNFAIDPPSWRSDLLQPADLVEEVARLVGYEKIPSHAPPRPLHASLSTAQKRLRSLSVALANKGFAEVQTFPFTHPSIIEKMGYQGERAATYRLANPMSDESPVLRVHLLPGLIEVASRNIGRGAKNFALFEVGSIFRATTPLTKAIYPPLGKRPSEADVQKLFASVPPQPIHMAGLLVGDVENEDWQGASRPYSWSDAISYAEELLDLCNITFAKVRSDFAPWHPGRCAELLVDGKPVAHAGELHPRVCSEFGVPERSAAFVINLSALPDSQLVHPDRVGTMPAAVQDVALIVDSTVSAAEVEDALRKGAGQLLESIFLFDRYDKIGEGKISLAFTLTFRAPDRTLKGEEISALREAAVVAAAKATGAVLRTA